MTFSRRHGPKPMNVSFHQQAPRKAGRPNRICTQKKETSKNPVDLLSQSVTKHQPFSDIFRAPSHYFAMIEGIPLRPLVETGRCKTPEKGVLGILKVCGRAPCSMARANLHCLMGGKKQRCNPFFKHVLHHLFLPRAKTKPLASNSNYS